LKEIFNLLFSLFFKHQPVRDAEKTFSSPNSNLNCLLNCTNYDILSHVMGNQHDTTRISRIILKAKIFPLDKATTLIIFEIVEKNLILSQFEKCFFINFDFLFKNKI
jgi:hypothetical protein